MKPSQEECVKLALTQFRTNPKFTAEEVEKIAPTTKVRVFDDNFETMNMMHLQFVFETRGEGFDLMVDLVPDDEKGWICFFDGNGPNDSYCAPDENGRYEIHWM